MAFNVGFIGLGIMGSRMAANLLARGYNLSVFNRTQDKADAHADQDYGAIFAFLTDDHDGLSAATADVRPAPARRSASLKPVQTAMSTARDRSA